MEKCTTRAGEPDGGKEERVGRGMVGAEIKREEE